jgi:hypothetical protein
MYSCHSDISPMRCKHDFVEYKSVKWAYVFTRECHYEKKYQDDRCSGCKHPHELDTQVPNFLEW